MASWQVLFNIPHEKCFKGPALVAHTVILAAQEAEIRRIRFEASLDK
jgi:hypothetical protein